MATKTKRSNKKLIIGLSIALLVLVGIVVWKGKGNDKSESVTTEKVQKRTIKEMVAASGKVFPEAEVKISSDVSGEVVELFIVEGDSVTKGQLLARINPDAYQSQVERGAANVNTSKAQLANSRASIEGARAQREQLEAQLTNAQAIFKRNTTLHQEGVISDADYEASQATLRQLEANIRASDANFKSSQESAKGAEFGVQSAAAALKELQTSLKKTSIYAPTSGIVSKLNIKKGERVLGTIQMAGTEILRIANLNSMEVQVEVSESDIPRVAIGNLVEIDVDAYPSRKFEGKVYQIANSAANTATATAALTSDQVTNFVVKIRILQSSYADLIGSQAKKIYPFRPGMSASVEINTNKLDGILSVPIQAVTTRDDDAKKTADKAKEKEEDELKSSAEQKSEKSASADNKKVKELVFVCSADTVKIVEVTTGIQDDSYIQIKTGLQEGEEIVAGPYTAVSLRLKSGTKITKNKDAKEKK